MKSIFYIPLLLLLLLPAFSFAQVEGLLHKRFGIRTGATISTLNSAPIGGNIAVKGGFYMGAYYQFRLKHNIGLSVELGYSRLGCNNANPGIIDSTANSAATVLYLNYLILPVSLKFYITKCFNFQIGLYGSALLNAIDKGTVYNNSGSQPFKQELGGYFSPRDAGIQAGIGFDRPSGFNFTFKYYNSLADIYPGFQRASGISLHNEFFQLTVGYSFPHK